MGNVELIVAHENTDFDALAACVAARKLYPDAVIGLGRRVAKPVRDFLALHKERFEHERTDRLDLDRVRALIVVDVRDATRLAHVARVLERRRAGEAIEVRIYDHHPASEDDLVGDVEIVEPVGAATTLLVERIRERGVALDPVEATLFALGIYTDTAALTLSSTTSRDARAIAWLLDRGASLAMVNRYLEVPFSDAQRRALATLLSCAHAEDVSGLSVGLAVLRPETHVEGLADVTSEACRMLQYAALFTLAVVPGKEKTEIVARGRSPLIDVGAALRPLGGGGHRGAASAVVKTSDADALARSILEALCASPPERTTVADVMSSPVHCVSPELTLDELGERLAAWGHGGVPVVREGALVGVVSRRDVERARAAGRSALPVSSHMHADVESTTPDARIEDALAQMVGADVGRLPVLRAGKLVGIGPRSDLLRLLYPRG